MPLDPNIAMGYRGIEVPNQLAQYGQIQQLQANQLKMQEAQAAAEERNALRQLNPASADYENQLFRVNPQLGIQYRKERSAAEASQAMAAQHKAEAALKQTELYRGQLANVQNRDQAAQWVQSQYADPVLGPVVSQVPLERAIAGIPTDPKAFADWKNQNALGMSDWIKRNTMTAAEKAVDARARERLAAESATGTLTPQSLDVAANVYLQTGQLPTGLGKAAANLRSQVMNRATELSTGKTAADVAGGIVEAKQDVASRGKAVKDFSTGVQGRQVNAFNTAIDHLATMDKLADALANNDIKAFNAIGNAFARQTGSAAPSNFDTAKNIVASEVAKAVAGSNMALKDREEIRDQILASSSPEQLKGVTATLKQLLGGQLKSLSLQYENTTGRKDFESKLTGEAKAEVQRLRGETKTAPAQTGGLSAAEQAELEQLRARFKK